MAIRILHVVGGMNRGGTETWLMHVLRHIDRQQYQMDFLVHTTEPCAYDDEIRALGSQIIPCLHPSHPWQYARNLKQILHEYGPYDVVHSHIHHYSGWVLWIARRAGVPMRIAHTHSDTSRLQAGASPARRIYYAITKHLIRKHATHGVAASNEAGVALFGSDWREDPRWRVLYCGIDLSPFQAHVDSMEIRKALQIPAGALVVGHVGRFVDAKNHRFFVEIARELVQLLPRVHFLLVGDGPLRPEIEAQVRQAGLVDCFTFVGLRDDVPRLMMGAMDVFLMPSIHEGLPLVLIEAQAAGLPCVLSDVVPEEAIIIPKMMTRLSLEQSPAVWAVAAIDMARNRTSRFQDEALIQVEQSALNITRSQTSLQSVYHDSL